MSLLFSTGRFLITQTEFLICFITIRLLSDEIKFTVNFDVLCQIFACKIYSFSSGCPSVESRDPRAFEKKHVNVENFPILLHFYVVEEKSY